MVLGLGFGDYRLRVRLYDVRFRVEGCCVAGCAYSLLKRFTGYIGVFHNRNT